MNTELIVVLDVDTQEEAMAIVSACGDCRWFKIGSQLFTRCGPGIVNLIQEQGKKVMLDLKFHDIPNTVNHAVQAAVDLGVSMLTLHAGGGRDMIEAAKRATEKSPTRLLAVTVLTSLNEDMLRNEVGIAESPAETVERWARMAIDAGAHGIVCSAQEITFVREAIGTEPMVVTPGIRPTWASADDQQRITTPKDASNAGASHIVVGRPILKHENPAEAVRLILEELA
jgi:orotidine-5'-phosphate decarboxylase